jgi:uncharacterized protein
MDLTDYLNTFGRDLQQRYGERIHKLTLNNGFTCPNRDGSKGRGGCTFCNNAAFSAHPHHPPAIATQFAQGRAAVAQTTRARRFIAYFQAYTNTYAELAVLRQAYDEALSHHDMVGLAVGTRPDCVSETVLDLLGEYAARGYEVWLELGLQSAFDDTLARVNRGHGFAEYAHAARAARARGLLVCTHLIFGLPGETPAHARASVEQVVAVGVDGLKLHPLHVVKHTVLAQQWRAGDYQPWDSERYVETVFDVLEHTPAGIRIHRVTATAGPEILLAPSWCGQKWPIINRLCTLFQERSSYQGKKCKNFQTAHT